MDREAWWATVHGLAMSRTWQRDWAHSQQWKDLNTLLFPENCSANRNIEINGDCAKDPTEEIKHGFTAQTLQHRYSPTFQWGHQMDYFPLPFLQTAPSPHPWVLGTPKRLLQASESFLQGNFILAQSLHMCISTVLSLLSSVQFSSVTQSCPTLNDPMNRSMPGLPVHQQLPEFTQTQVYWVGDAIQPSHPLSSTSPVPNPSQHQSFPMSQLFAWGSQSTGVSALASFFPKNTQSWSPLIFIISFKSLELGLVEALYVAFVM